MTKRINYIDYAEYNEIICRLIYEFGITSLIKLIFVSFSLKNSEYILKTASNKKYGTLDVIYYGIKIGFTRNVKDFLIIFDCLELLKNSSFIDIKDGTIKQLNLKPFFSKEIKYLNMKVIEKAINEVKKISDDSIIRGIIEYV